MAKVAVTKDKLDDLALHIAAKADESLPMTIDEMMDAVDGIETGGGTPTLQAKTRTIDSAGTFVDTPDSGYDGLSSVTTTVPEGEMYTGGTSGYYTESGVRKWRYQTYAAIDVGDSYGTPGFIENGTVVYSELYVHNAIPRETTVTPSTSAQTIGGSNYMMEGAVTVAAMPSGTAGTPTATKGSVSNHSVSITPSVTNTAGYIGGGTKTGTAVSVSASELVSGSYTVDASGNHDVTNYASASVAAGSATASATKGSVSNHSVSITPSVTRTAGYVTAGSANGTAVSVSASELVSGSQTITTNGTVDVTNLASVVVNVSGGSGGGSAAAQTATSTVTPSSAGNTIRFTNLEGQPTSFAVLSAADLATGASPFKVAAVVYDGTSVHAQTVTNTNNAQATYDGSAFSQSYSNGTLTITSSGAYFQAVQYKLVYTYGSSNVIETAQTQVGSGATSVTFTGLTAEPSYFGVIFKSNFSTSNGYQRVMAVARDGSSTYGVAMDSGAKALSSWSYTYSNGSLTVTSTGTNNGGYFHQPGYYQLVCAYGTVEPDLPSYQDKTVTPTESEQTVEADDGYDALSSVTVGAISSSYVGSGITRRSSTDLTASGDTVTVPAGYYSSQATKAVASGSAGTPTATKGAVSNNSVTITPSVTNTTGYITGSTKTGTAVTVSASELVSGSQNITSNNTYDVTNLASVVVNVAGGIGTLLNTTSIGAVSTTSTQAASLNISLSVSGVNSYDLLIVESSVNTVTNNRHTATVGLIFLTAGSAIDTKNGATIATAKWNSKASSTGTTTTNVSTTAYGVYPNSCTISSGTATIPMYRRYNSTSTGTMNGTYTARVYGVNLYDLIGG